MIKIERKADVPAILTTDGVVETNKAIAYFSRKKPGTDFKFAVYNNKAVKTVLRNEFYMKCAYCESTFMAVYPGDVEHFRPKGKVIEKKLDHRTGKNKNVVLSEKGYYWLAANWDNLLLSCKLCNQEQTHELPGEEPLVMGKKNQFPLRKGAEAKRLKTPLKNKIAEQVQQEDKYRLIINPCKEDPEEYFSYDAEKGFIIPLATAPKHKQVVAQVSIRVYALQRMPLVMARQELLIDIQAQQNRILDLHKEYQKVLRKRDELSLVRKIYFEKQLEKELRFLRTRYLRPSQPYLGMCRYVIGGFLKSWFGIEI